MILVVGATGKVGREVVAQLGKVGVDVRAFAHSAARDLENVEVVFGDLSDSSSIARALGDVTDVFLVWPLFTADAALPVVAEIASRGAQIVYLSTLAVRDDVARPTHPFTAFHTEIESAIRGSGTSWTLLRASKFASNALGWGTQLRSEGEIRLPFPDSRRSPIHGRDIAAVAVRCLLDERQRFRTHVVTGPRSLTEADQIAIIGRAAGREFACRRVPADEARAELMASGSSRELADAAIEYWAGFVTDPEPVTKTVEELCGNQATDFEVWADEHSGFFR